MPCASQAIGLTRTRWLIGVPDRLARARSLRSALVRQRQLGRAAHSLAAARAGRGRRTPSANTSQRAEDQVDRAVGMPAGAASRHERGQAAAMRCLALAWAAPAAICSTVAGERVQAVHAGPALAGALVGQPARHARGLGDRAGLLGQQQHDPRPERGPVRRQVFVGQGQAVQELAADPGAARSRRSARPRGRGGGPAGGVDQRGQRGAVLDLIDPRVGDRRRTA